MATDDHNKLMDSTGPPPVAHHREAPQQRSAQPALPADCLGRRGPLCRPRTAQRQDNNQLHPVWRVLSKMSQSIDFFHFYSCRSSPIPASDVSEDLADWRSSRCRPATRGCWASPSAATATRTGATSTAGGTIAQTSMNKYIIHPTPINFWSIILGQTVCTKYISLYYYSSLA